MDVESPKDDQNGRSYARIFGKLLFTVFYSGILAGSLGLGGGLVINPVLLSEGFRPEKASAVSALIVLFTAMTTSTQFLIAGAFDFGYAFYIMITSIAGSYLGNIFLKKLVKKYNKPSLFIWILAGLLLTSGVVLGITGTIRLAQQENLFRFGSPC